MPSVGLPESAQRLIANVFSTSRYGRGSLRYIRQMCSRCCVSAALVTEWLFQLVRQVFSVVLLLCSLFGQAAITIIYPAPDSPSDTRHVDKLEFLKAALERTVPRYGAYELKPASVVMNKARQLVTIKSGDELTLIWGSTSPELEQDLLPIRICLRKGLMGYRIALIAKERQAEFDKVKNVEMLKKFLIGQGNGWGDVPILRRAGLNVMTGNYSSLFRMLAAGRIDLFPRGVTEVFNEWEANYAELPNLAIESGLLIYYPSPYYFFVSKQNSTLAARLEEGLRMMLKDGSFDEIFWRYNGDSIMKAKFNRRRIIRLENPTLSPKTPLKEKALWFDPARLNVRK